MQMVSKAARRYARALLDSAVEQKNLESIYEDVLFVENTISGSNDLKLFLKSPIVRKEVKRAALKEIFKDQVGELTYSLINILSSKSREKHLHEIMQGFLIYYNEHHNIIKVGANSAFELDEGQKKDLQNKLESVTGKSVQLTVQTEEDLIGGITVQIADTVIDGSVKHKLNQLKDTFTAAVE